jgi:hypothetical protein
MPATGGQPAIEIAALPGPEWQALRDDADPAA